MIYRLSNQGEKNIALRFSEYEGLDTIMAMKGKVNWVWVDCLTKLPIDKNSFALLKKKEFKLCLVSPDLLGREQDIPIYKNLLAKKKIVFDSICTKYHNIKKWS